MFKKSAIALGLAMVAGSGMAAQGTTGVNADTGVSAQAGGAVAGADTSSALKTQFKALDSNGDGMLSRSEANANSRISKIYDSLDTSETIEAGAEQSAGGGISFEQFESGLQAQSSASGGVVGDAVSKGEPRVVNDSRSGASGAAAKMRERTGDAMSKARDKMQSTGASTQERGSATVNDGKRAYGEADAGAETRMRTEGSAEGKVDSQMN